MGRDGRGPELFRLAGVQAHLFMWRDGKNINEGCGALHPETLGRLLLTPAGNLI